jgi:hypothetical protein
MRCKRCGDLMTLYVVGDRYCRPCKVEVAVLERREAMRIVPRFSRAKDLTPWPGGAA